MKSVTYLKEDRNIEVVLVLPHPNVPLRLVAPDNLSAPKTAGDHAPGPAIAMRTRSSVDSSASASSNRGARRKISAAA